ETVSDFPGGFDPSISGDGRYVAYTMNWNGSNPTADIAVVDRIANFQLGGPADDIILGSARTDLMHGGVGGNDSLFGGAGNDVLFAFDGVDRLTGGPGSDIFVIAPNGAGVQNSGLDIVTDFTPGVGGDVLNIADL